MRTCMLALLFVAFGLPHSWAQTLGDGSVWDGKLSWKVPPFFKALPREKDRARPWELDKMPVARPDPRLDYKVRRMTPSPGIEFEMLIARPWVQDERPYAQAEALTAPLETIPGRASAGRWQATLPPLPLAGAWARLRWRGALAFQLGP